MKLRLKGSAPSKGAKLRIGILVALGAIAVASAVAGLVALFPRQYWESLGPYWSLAEITYMAKSLALECIKRCGLLLLFAGLGLWFLWSVKRDFRRYFPQCGRRVRPRAKECRNCGHDLGTPPEEQNAPD
jgi:hypothetical protein